MTNKDDILAISKLSDNELYAMLGEKVTGSRAFPPVFEELINLGKNWFAAKKDELAAIICPNKTICAFADKDVGSIDLVFLATAIADIIVGEGSIVLAVLVSRYGISKLCKSYWT